MNKQAITFLTLFSLILVLSIYYILLPPTDENEIKVVQEKTSQIEILQQDLDEERAKIISENNEIIASSTNDSQTISAALETIAKTKDLTNKEKEIVALLKENGYNNSFVEIENKIVKVTVEKKDASSADAGNIMKLILEKIGSEYQIEVKFISEWLEFYSLFLYNRINKGVWIWVKNIIH